MSITEVAPYRWCSFRTCRFCGAHRGQKHKPECNWTDMRNPFPDTLFGTDADWDNVEWFDDNHEWAV